MAYYIAIYLTGTEPSKSCDWNESSSQGIKNKSLQILPFRHTSGFISLLGSYFGFTQAIKYLEEILPDPLARQQMPVALMFSIPSYFNKVSNAQRFPPFSLH